MTFLKYLTNKLPPVLNNDYMGNNIKNTINIGKNILYLNKLLYTARF